MPANFAVGSEFGENRTTRIRGRSVSYQHEGLDIPAPQGTPIFAVMEGEVVARNCEQVEGRSYGNCLMILHPNGRMSLYAHLANSNRSCPQFNEIKNQIRSGQRVYVSQGDQIGCVGSTGRSSGPHLHFEFRPEGVFPSTGSGDRVFDPNDECGYHETRRRRR